jgi:molecular chaperone GrpE
MMNDNIFNEPSKLNDGPEDSDESLDSGLGVEDPSLDSDDRAQPDERPLEGVNEIPDIPPYENPPEEDNPLVGEAEILPPESETVDLAAEAQLYKDKYLRALADQENVRRRSEKQVEDARKYGVERVLLEIIPVMDNLNLALTYIDPDNAQVKNLALGVEMTVKDCLERLSPLGFKELKASPGDTFDPKFHEGVASISVPDLPNGTIAKMVKPGYLLHDRLLRPVIVNLVKNETSVSDEPEGSDA